MSNNTVTIGWIEPVIITETSCWSRTPKAAGDEMNPNDSTTESKSEEIQVFRDFSRLSIRDDASTDTKSIMINQMGITEFPSVINIVNWILA